jgi:hypothetical protein
VAVERKHIGGAQGVRTVLLLLCAETAVSVFYSFLPSLVSLHSLSLLFLYFLDDDGAVGGGWEERWRR